MSAKSKRSAPKRSNRAPERSVRTVRRNWPRLGKLQPSSWVAVQLETDHGPAVLIARTYRREVHHILADYFDTSLRQLEELEAMGGYAR